jgi:SAM-dependent methyltransferase
MTEAILNLGCGNRPLGGAVNHDRAKYYPHVDVAHDLNVRPWPWADESFDMIVANAVFEHLRLNLVEVCDECWRILRAGGLLHLKLPWWQSDNAYADPTHYWQYSLRSLNVLDPGTVLGKRYEFYTTCHWEIVAEPKLNESKTSFVARLRVRK